MFFLNHDGCLSENHSLQIVRTNCQIYIAYNEHKQEDIHKQNTPNQIVQKLCDMQTNCMDGLRMKCKLSPSYLLISHYPPVAEGGGRGSDKTSHFNAQLVN